MGRGSHRIKKRAEGRRIFHGWFPVVGPRLPRCDRDDGRGSADRARVGADVVACVDRPGEARTGVEACLVGFGVMFALNSSVHSYLVLAYSETDRVSLSVGFYYTANAAGRLLGTLLSGLLYQRGGLAASLWGAVALSAAAGFGALFLPPVA